jgi:hypothetical protein
MYVGEAQKKTTRTPTKTSNIQQACNLNDKMGITIFLFYY